MAELTARAATMNGKIKLKSKSHLTIELLIKNTFNPFYGNGAHRGSS